MLEAIGLEEDEEQTYLALLGRGPSAVKELFADTGIARPSLTRALKVLEGHGLVTKTPDDPPLYVPARPDVALEALVLRRQEELERVRLAGRQLLKQAKRSESVGASELIEVVEGREAFARRFVQLQRMATKEVIEFDRPPYMTERRTCSESEIDALRRGVAYRVIYDSQSLLMDDSLEMVRQRARAGERAKILAGVPMKLAIADGRVGLVPLNVESGRERAIVVHPSPLLEALGCLFDTLWESAPSIRFGVTPSPESADANDSLSDSDRNVLEFLAQGFKDEVIAAQLGMGLSTVQRRIRSMMQRLGAQSRFQAGVEAADRGWIAAQSR